MFDLVFVPLIDPIDPPKVSDPVFVPSFKPESSIEPTFENRIGKVCSRKKAAIPRLIQVQEYELTSGNEVTGSHLPLQTVSEL